MRKELEKRLEVLCRNVMQMCKGLEKDFASRHLSSQLIRSSSSAALNYGEAQAAESKNDFIHKVSIVLKELRETQICLNLLSDEISDNFADLLDSCKDECSQLVAIFHKTVMTAKSNR